METNFILGKFCLFQLFRWEFLFYGKFTGWFGDKLYKYLDPLRQAFLSAPSAWDPVANDFCYNILEKDMQIFKFWKF